MAADQRNYLAGSIRITDALGLVILCSIMESEAWKLETLRNSQPFLAIRSDSLR
jgi:hypothetical protein